MRNSRIQIHAWLFAFAMLSGCAAPEPADPGPPPPQNLIGSTDELQLVTELSLNLAKEYGGESILVVLGVDRTLLTKNANFECDPVSRDAVLPTQADAPEQVRRMQSAGLRVIALTGRSPDCSAQTFRELAGLGFGRCLA